MATTHFARKFSTSTGIGQLMKDLGEAASDTSDAPLYMLGGGNPGAITAVIQRLRTHLHSLADSEHLNQVIGCYDAPEGDHRFRQALASLFKERFDWPVTHNNIALTNGSQSAFFTLFNLLAGPTDTPAAPPRQILLPLTPEYIGYTDTGLSASMFASQRPLITRVDDCQFKYAVDFESLNVGEHVSALCVSRPTNPTGNVLTDDEVATLSTIAQSHGIPLIIDGAYGLPFPGIVFNAAQVNWNEHIILCLSLSKLGLPGARTGIVIASEAMIELIASVNAVTSLAVGSLGPAVVQPMVDSGEILEISETIIKPYYQAKAQRSLELLADALHDTPWQVHIPEGAFFMWLWLPDLPISAQTLYERLKRRRVFVIPGHHFFPGLQADNWDHKQQCLRISYAQDETTVKDGLAIIGEEVRRAYAAC